MGEASLLDNCCLSDNRSCDEEELAGCFLSLEEPQKMLSVAFEVHGKVQGVFFRKYTEKQAKLLGLRGWVMNTSAGTVKGVLEGEEHAIKQMKSWLQHTGSPTSKIEKAEFKEEKNISKFTFSDFQIKR